MGSVEKRFWSLWAGCGLVVLTLGVYWRVGGHEFLNYDDNSYVTANPHVQAGLTWSGVGWAFGRIHGEETYWHPLTWLSHMVDCQLFGLNAGAHHWVNLLFHAINGVLLFLLLKKTTGLIWQSVVVASLFSVHPIQLDTVAWIAERKNVLSTFFALLALLAYVRYAQRPGLGRYSLIVFWFVLGLMSKPVLVTLPCVMLLLDWWPLRRFPLIRLPGAASSRGSPSRSPRFAPAPATRLMVEKLPLFALSVASGVVTILAHRGLGITDEVVGLPLKLRIENAFVSYMRYLDHAIWPNDLAILYPHPGMWPTPKVVLSVVVLLVVTGVVLRFWRRSPYLAVGWFWFLGVLVPTIGLLQAGVQAMADRFMYVPLVGLLIMIVWGVSDLAKGWRNRKSALILGSAIAVAACAISASLQLSRWKNSISVFEHALRVTENNFVIHYNLGITLRVANRLNEALPHFLEAARLRPDYAEAHYQAGVILELQNKPNEAITHYREATRFKPNWPASRRALGDLLAQLGNIDQAIVEYAAAARLAPEHPETRVQLGALLAQKGQTAEAVREWREALKLKPDWPELLNNLAWLLATHPRAEFRDGSEAVQLAERACQLTQYRRAILVGTLAAAYAETGRFNEASSTAQKAHDIALENGDKELAAKNLKLLEHYRANQPYREVSNPQ